MLFPQALKVELEGKEGKDGKDGKDGAGKSTKRAKIGRTTCFSNRAGVCLYWKCQAFLLQEIHFCLFLICALRCIGLLLDGSLVRPTQLLHIIVRKFEKQRKTFSKNMKNNFKEKTKRGHWTCHQ